MLSFDQSVQLLKLIFCPSKNIFLWKQKKQKSIAPSGIRTQVEKKDKKFESESTIHLTTCSRF